MGGHLRPGGKAAVAAATVLGLLVLAPGAGAVEIDVDTFADEVNNGNGDCSLREAITSAVTDNNAGESGCEQGESTAADSVNLDPGTYTLGDEGQLFFGQADGQRIHVTGATDTNGVPTTTIDGNNATRIIDLGFDAGGSIDVFLHNLILTHGSVPSTSTGDGAAVRIEDPDAFFGMENGKVVDNHAGHDGGAIRWQGADDASEF